MKILSIEDDLDISELIEYNLKQEKWNCLMLASGEQALEKIREYNPDLVLLDLMLPDVSGLDICRQIRSQEDLKHLPVILLTAKGEEIDRIVGFEIGADDYIAKPFSPRELILRIKAIIKRSSSPQEAVTKPAKSSLDDAITFGVLSLDPQRYQVTVEGSPVQLTSLEFKILNYFLNHRGFVATREVLLDKVWGYQPDLTTRTVDTHIKRLREKIGKAGSYIETIRGIGYRFCEAP